jgi:hypothetical protein
VSLICADDETTGKAAITGDFVLIASEANLVIKALRDNGVEVTALISHMLTDSPHLFFMHFWANDDAQKLARGAPFGAEQSDTQIGPCIHGMRYMHAHSFLAILSVLKIKDRKLLIPKLDVASSIPVARVNFTRGDRKVSSHCRSGEI